MNLLMLFHMTATPTVTPQKEHTHIVRSGLSEKVNLRSEFMACNLLAMY